MRGARKSPGARKSSPSPSASQTPEQSAEGGDLAAKPTLSNQERSELTRLRILSAALSIITENGSRRLSLSAIADAAGLSKAGLLHHYGTKADLLHAVLDVRDEVDRYPGCHSDAVGTELLDRLVNDVRQWAARPRTIGVFTTLLVDNLNEADPLHERLVERARTVQVAFAKALEAGKRTGTIDPAVPVDRVAAAIIAFLNGLETYWLLDRSLPVVEIAEGWRDTLARQLSPSPLELGAP